MLGELSTPALIRSIEENPCQLWKYLSARWPRMEVHDDPKMLWSVSNIPFPLFNSVLRTRLSPDSVERAIVTAIARCKSRSIPLLWWTWPSTRPKNLGSSLKAHGFIHEEDSPGMAIDLRKLDGSQPALPGLRIELVDNPTRRKHWSHTCRVGAELPEIVEEAFSDCAALDFTPGGSLYNCIGWLEGQPVATSSLFLGAGVAGIYNVTTIPAARRKGIGSAMTVAVLDQARTLGYRVGILHSSPMGFNVYRKLGFEEYCKINQYVWTAESR
jgi:ribosomal protein S18 acetylase RimI-like enzyme